MLNLCPYTNQLPKLWPYDFVCRTWQEFVTYWQGYLAASCSSQRLERSHILGWSGKCPYAGCFSVSSTQTSHFGRGWEKMLIRLAHSACGTFSWLMPDMGGAQDTGQCYHWVAGPGCSKKAGWASQQAAGTPLSDGVWPESCKLK